MIVRGVNHTDVEKAMAMLRGLRRSLADWDLVEIKMTVYIIVS